MPSDTPPDPAKPFLVGYARVSMSDQNCQCGRDGRPQEQLTAADGAASEAGADEGERGVMGDDAKAVDLQELMRKAHAAFDALTPEQQAAQRRAQRRSYVIAEMGLGSDADQAAYAAAHHAGDWDTVARLQREAESRRCRAAEMYDRMGL
jgi:hypothetical protein